MWMNTTTAWDPSKTSCICARAQPTPPPQWTNSWSFGHTAMNWHNRIDLIWTRRLSTESWRTSTGYFPWRRWVDSSQYAVCRTTDTCDGNACMNNGYYTKSSPVRRDQLDSTVRSQIWEGLECLASHYSFAYSAPGCHTIRRFALFPTGTFAAVYHASSECLNSEMASLVRGLSGGKGAFPSRMTGTLRIPASTAAETSWMLSLRKSHLPRSLCSGWLEMIFL